MGADDGDREALLDGKSGGGGAPFREVLRDAPRTREVRCTARQWYERPGTMILCTIAALTVFGAVLRDEEVARGIGNAPESLSVGTAWTGNGTTRTITMEELLEFGSVQQWFTNMGVVFEDLDTVAQLQLLPSRMTVYVDAEGIDGGIGASAGYVAFNVANSEGVNASSYFSSFLIIMEYASGDIVSIIPTFDAQSFSGLGEGNFNTTFCGIKFKDPDTLLLGGNAQQTEYGGSYTMRWAAAEDLDFTMLPGGMRTSHNCHDIQWSFDKKGYWVPAGGGLGNQLNFFDAAAGERMKDIGFEDITQDINHAQFVSEDGGAYLSSRLTSAVLKVNASTGGIDWVAGGADGTYTVYHLDGTVYGPGDFPFNGQHNAEYFGENELFMVDNQYDETRPTFYRVYAIDEVAETLTEVWNYAYAAYPYGNMPYYGDLDRLPTGNVLTTFWPGALEASADDSASDSAEFYISEIDRDADDKIVWELQVYGLVSYDCSTEGSIAGCAREDWGGWRAYSAERFLSEPLVYDASCRVTPGNSTVLRFSSVNAIKQQNVALGSWRLAEGSATAQAWTGEFGWNPHWRTTDVEAVLGDHSLAGTSLTLAVTNEWGIAATTEVACARDDGEAR